jgi:hypothetical protein
MNGWTDVGNIVGWKVSRRWAYSVYVIGVMKMDDMAWGCAVGFFLVLAYVWGIVVDRNGIGYNMCLVVYGSVSPVVTWVCMA